jgi:RND superfamily putative drug exporter
MFCAAWLVLGLGLTLVAPSWDTRVIDDDIRFLPAHCDSVRGYQLLSQAFPQDISASRAFFTLERTDRTLDREDLALSDRCVAALNRLRQEEPNLQLGRVYSHRDPFIGKRLVSADRHCCLIQLSLATPFLALQTQATVDRAENCLRAVLAEAWPDPPDLHVTGPAGIGRDLTTAAGKSLEGTTTASVVLVVILLLLVYRAPLLALVPLVTIGISIWVALKALALLTLVPGIYLVNVSKVFAIVLLYGAGTDYCLFLISRYREELSLGLDLKKALANSVVHVGGTLTASAGTVVLGLSMMVFAEFAKVRCAGPAIALSLVVALLASLTLTPALLRLMRKAAFWPGQPPVQPNAGSRGTLWNRLGQLVVGRPVVVVVVSIALLSPLAVVGLTLKSNFKPTGELGPTADSVQGLEVIQRRFTAGDIGPVTFLLTSNADWSSPTGRGVIARLCRGISHLDNVAEVRSLTQPLGIPLPIPDVAPSEESKGLLSSFLKTIQQTADEVRQRAEGAAREIYLAALPGAAEDGKTMYVTRLDVVLRSDPFAQESIATLEALQTWLRRELPQETAGLEEVGWESFGVTVNTRDLAQVTESDRQRINLLVLGGILAILLLVVRRLWLAAFLLATVMFSYLAALGTTALAGFLLSGHVLTEVDWRVPFFLFIILVAVGEDYNILIITRTLEERRRRGTEAGIREALARTGGAITSCGLIMAGTFGTLMLASLGTLAQTGFALAFGVLLDTFVVCTFLVPAFTLLVWRSGKSGTNHYSRQRAQASPQE